MPVGGDDDTIANEPATERPTSVAASFDDTELIAGRYRILRWLGAGGMGRVYEALDTELDERVALKVLRAGLSDEAIERFRREVKLTRRIQHRNVARMFDIGDHRNDKFLTMELIDGVALSRELGGGMAWQRLSGIAEQLCAGLAAAHAAGVIHRDLKPDNVMIERGTDRVVITDFGIARSGDEVGVTQVGALMGTPRYMAPEQLAGALADHRADMFALGVMLYELATGTRPWSGDTAIAIAVAQATQPARPFAAHHVPREFAALIGQCIALDPAQRPQSAAAIGEAIAAGVPFAAPDPEEVVTLAEAPAFAAGPTGVVAPVAPTTTTVAVLPLGCAAGDEYLADGLLDDLIDTLSSSGTLRVRPSGVVRSRAEIDPRALGKSLEVDHVVVGSLRRAATGLRIAARLIGVADGFQIWAHRVDCSEAEILLAAEQIGREVASALSARAVTHERPTDPRAVELYLRARAELRRFWGDHAENATALLTEAAGYAPGSAPIVAALAYASVQAWVMRGEPGLIPRAREAVERGLATGHGEAFLASATLMIGQGDPETAAAALGTALVRAPMSAQAHESAGRILIEVEAGGDGRRHLATALALEPGRAHLIGSDFGRLDALEGNWDGAYARCRQLLGDPDPSVVQLGSVLESRLACWRSDEPAMVAAATRFAPRLEQAARLLAFFQDASLAGELDPAQWAVLEATFTRRDRPFRMQIMGLQLMSEIAIVLGHIDLGLRALGKASDMGLIDVMWLDRCPLFHRVARDLRWQAVRDQVARRAARVLAAFRSTAG